MQYLLLALFFVPQLLFTQAVGANADKTNPMEIGLNYYAMQKYNDAYSAFRNGISQNPKDGSLYFNMALSAHRAKKAGLAVSLARHASALYPNWQEAKNLVSFLEKTYRIEDDRSFFSKVFTSGYLDSSYFVWTYILAFLTLGIALWRLAEYLGEKRTFRDEIDDELRPQMSSTITWAFLISVLLFGLGGLQTYENGLTLVTVLPDKAYARSLPESQAAPLFDLKAGQQLEVLQKRQNWILVERSDGFVGWISKNELYQHQGPKNDQLSLGQPL